MKRKRIKTKDIVINILLSFLLGILTLGALTIICFIGSALLPILGICLIGGIVLAIIKFANK